MRRVTELLDGYAFAVVNLPADSEREASAEIYLRDDPADPAHTVVVPLTEAGRRRLVEQLTGGILIGSNHTIA